MKTTRKKRKRPNTPEHPMHTLANLLIAGGAAALEALGAANLEYYSFCDWAGKLEPSEDTFPISWYASRWAFIAENIVSQSESVSGAFRFDKRIAALAKAIRGLIPDVADASELDRFIEGYKTRREQLADARRARRKKQKRAASAAA